MKVKDCGLKINSDTLEINNRVNLLLKLRMLFKVLLWLMLQVLMM